MKPSNWIVAAFLATGAAALVQNGGERTAGERPVVLASMIATGGGAAPADWAIHPDTDHPLLGTAVPSVSLETALRSAPLGYTYAPLAHLLDHPDETGRPPPGASAPPIELPVLGPASVDRGRVVLPQSPGARFEFRLDRPRAAFVKRF